MASPKKDVGRGLRRQRSESVATPAQTDSPESVNVRPEIRDRSHSVSTNEVPQPPSTGFDPTDRVFPMRSVVSVDPSASSQRASSRGAISPTREGARHYTFIDEQTWNSLKSGSESQSQHRPDPEHAEPTIPTNTSRHKTHATNDKTELATHPEIYAKPVTSDSQPGSGSTAHPGSQTEPKTDEEHILTARFKHVVTDNGHAIITGREGEELQYCEDEPIRIVGSTLSVSLDRN
jgi:hypothetical protein